MAKKKLSDYPEIKNVPLAAFPSSELEPGEDWSNPINEQHPELANIFSGDARLWLKTFADAGPKTMQQNLEAAGFEVRHRGEMRFSLRKPGEREWRVMDPGGWRNLDPREMLKDIADVVPSWGATGLGMVKGAAVLGAQGLALSGGNPVVGAGLGLLGAGLGAGGAEAIKQGAGAMLGYDIDPSEALGKIALEGATGVLAPATGLLARSQLGREVIGRAGKGLGQIIAPVKRGLVRSEQAMRDLQALARRRAAAPEAKAALEVPPPPTAPELPLGPPRAPRSPEGLRPPETLPPGAIPELPPEVPRPGPGAIPAVPGVKAPGIRHTLRRGEGGEITQAVEQLRGPSEKVAPFISEAEAKTLERANFETVVPLIEDAAPGEEIFVTFLKKAKPLTKKALKEGKTPEPREVRTMQLHRNIEHPPFISQGEVHKQVSKMPMDMLRELAEEHGPPPGFVKKSFGTNDPAKLNREALATWLYEKQPGVVTERAGASSQARAAENKAFELVQFWEQFAEHLPPEDAAKSAKRYLSNAIRGTKEYGGFKRFGDIMDVRIGDRVYQFVGGKPKLVSGTALPGLAPAAPKIAAPKLAAAPAAPPPGPGLPAAPPGGIEGRLQQVAQLAQRFTGGALKGASSVLEAPARFTKRRIEALVEGLSRKRGSKFALQQQREQARQELQTLAEGLLKSPENAAKPELRAAAEEAVDLLSRRNLRTEEIRQIANSLGDVLGLGQKELGQEVRAIAGELPKISAPTKVLGAVPIAGLAHVSGLKAASAAVIGAEYLGKGLRRLSLAITRNTTGEMLQKFAQRATQAGNSEVAQALQVPLRTLGRGENAYKAAIFILMHDPKVREFLRSEIGEEEPDDDSGRAVGTRGS